MNRITEREERAAAQLEPEPRILNLHLHGKSVSSIEAVIRLRIDELAQAIRDRNIDRVMSLYATDVVVFDVRPPLEVRGAQSYRRNFERWFAPFEGPIQFEYKDLRIVPGEGAAFCHFLSLVSGSTPGRTSGYWVRGTTCFEQREGQWLITHEHISMPTV